MKKRTAILVFVGFTLAPVVILHAWQMRHSYCLISRNQPRSATITGVTQPSSANERSSINPCDR